MKMNFKTLTHADADDILGLYAQTEDYFLLAEGALPKDCKELLSELPPNTEPNRKTVTGAYMDGRLIALTDCVYGYPREDVCMLGLLLVDKRYRRNGIGKTVFGYAVEQAKAKGMNRIRIGVFESNENALRFWSRLGFERVDVKGPVSVGEKKHMIEVFERDMGDVL